MLDLLGHAARAAEEKKAADIVVLDIHEQLAIVDYFLICSGASDRQVRTIVDEIGGALKRAGARAARTEGQSEGTWVLLDYDDFVVHVFRDAEREFYDLERLWKDAPRVDLASRAAAGDR